FSFCNSLEEIVIPRSVVIINKEAFYYNDKLKKVYCEVEEKLEGWNKFWIHPVPEVIWSYKEA
ncbi:MAG: hypothetical protein WC006_09335, partial [Bacilli bacterium]